MSHYLWQESGFQPTEGSLSWISEAERFTKDAAALNKMERDMEVNRQQQKFYNRRYDLPCPG